MTAQEMSVRNGQSFLRAVPDQQLAELGGTCRQVVVPAGQRLFEEGSIADRFWLTGARAVRAACDADPVLGYGVSRRFSAVLLRRLQATRSRLLSGSAQPGPAS